MADREYAETYLVLCQQSGKPWAPFTLLGATSDEVERIAGQRIERHNHYTHGDPVTLVQVRRLADVVAELEQLADLQRRLERLQRVADAAGVLWHSQNAFAPITPEKIRRQEWTVVEVGRDAMAALGDALDLAAAATPEVGDG